MVSSQVQQARSGVFIDASNIFWGAREAGFRVDFAKLKEYLDARFSPAFLNYYCCEDEIPSTPEFARRAEGQKDFHNLLEGIGYSVIRKPLKHIKGGGTKCDVDVDIAVDLRNYEDDIDCIILFSATRITFRWSNITGRKESSSESSRTKNCFPGSLKHSALGIHAATTRCSMRYDRR